MNKNLFGVMVVFAIIVVLLSFKATNRRPKPHELEITSRQFQNQIPIKNTNLKQTIPIRLSKFTQINSLGQISRGDPNL